MRRKPPTVAMRITGVVVFRNVLFEGDEPEAAIASRRAGLFAAARRISGPAGLPQRALDQMQGMNGRLAGPSPAAGRVVGVTHILLIRAGVAPQPHGPIEGAGNCGKRTIAR